MNLSSVVSELSFAGWRHVATTPGGRVGSVHIHDVIYAHSLPPDEVFYPTLFTKQNGGLGDFYFLSS